MGKASSETGFWVHPLRVAENNQDWPETQSNRQCTTLQMQEVRKDVHQDEGNRSYPGANHEMALFRCQPKTDCPTLDALEGNRSKPNQNWEHDKEVHGKDEGIRTLSATRPDTNPRFAICWKLSVALESIGSRCKGCSGLVDPCTAETSCPRNPTPT